jgi:hypothetical protein
MDSPITTLENVLSQVTRTTASAANAQLHLLARPVVERIREAGITPRVLKPHGEFPAPVRLLDSRALRWDAGSAARA